MRQNFSKGFWKIAPLNVSLGFSGKLLPLGKHLQARIQDLAGRDINWLSTWMKGQH
jgi:hypothetical protein